MTEAWCQVMYSYQFVRALYLAKLMIIAYNRFCVEVKFSQARSFQKLEQFKIHLFLDIEHSSTTLSLVVKSKKILILPLGELPW